jgi:hypothetical protein
MSASQFSAIFDQRVRRLRRLSDVFAVAEGVEATLVRVEVTEGVEAPAALHDVGIPVGD